MPWPSCSGLRHGLLRAACEGEELESAAGWWAADPAVRLA